MNPAIKTAGLSLVTVLSTSVLAMADDTAVTVSEKRHAYKLALHYSHVDPIGVLSNVDGDVEIKRIDGSTFKAAPGTEVGLGDIVETGAKGTVDVDFDDGTNFKVHDDSRIALDEFVYGGRDDKEPDHSVLRSIFLYTSKVLGRDDPENVEPQIVGGGGIRG